MLNKTNSKKYLERNFPELLNYKRVTSRMYKKEDKPNFRDNWWFNFMEDDLDAGDFIIFAGALDADNREFKIFKVPTEFLKAHKDKIDIGGSGWTNLYIHLTDFADVRHPANLSFREFAVN